MKISTKLPQFRNAPALFIVTGAHDAVVYYAVDGVITNVASFRVEKPQYTDREGHSVRRGRRGMLRISEAGRERRHEEERSLFLRMLQTSLQHVVSRTPLDVVYVFTPKHLKDMVAAALPERVRQHVARIVTGNYVDAHPLALIAKVVPMASVASTPDEVRRLLKKLRKGQW